MKKDIYIEVAEILENYSSFRRADIFNLINENIFVFDKEAIEGNLKATLDQVLGVLSQPSFQHSANRSFNDQPSINLARQFSEYLEYRCKYDYQFHQGPRYLERKDFDAIRALSIKDYTILNNRFFNSLPFYFYGRIDFVTNNDHGENEHKRNHYLINGIEGGRATVIFSNYDYSELRLQRISDEGIKCLFYGIISFDPYLRENVIKSSRIICLE